MSLLQLPTGSKLGTMNYFNDDVLNKTISDIIHKKYASKCNIRRHEYNVHINQDLREDTELDISGNGHECDLKIIAGNVVNIITRYPPVPATIEGFKKCMRHAFSQDLRTFVYNTLPVLKSTADNWHSISIDKIEEVAKHYKWQDMYSAATIQATVAVKITDKKTGKSVKVELANSTTFEAENRALQLLYGDDYND